ncbi:hypothetical protein [Baaleninema sp.]|uniref:hypothetical protein n=1 Tax=Baaleninema sp. TaxID=3101197 RepID=UPI003CFEE69D
MRHQIPGILEMPGIERYARWVQIHFSTSRSCSTASHDALQSAGIWRSVETRLFRGVFAVGGAIVVESPPALNMAVLLGLGEASIDLTPPLSPPTGAICSVS